MNKKCGALALALLLGCATGPAADGGADARGDAAACAGPNCVGAAAPGWQLADFNPKSPGHGQTYGLQQFSGQVVLVALLSAW